MWRNVDTGAVTTTRPQGTEDGGYIWDSNTPTQIVPGDPNVGMKASRWEPYAMPPAAAPSTPAAAPQTPASSSADSAYGSLLSMYPKGEFNFDPATFQENKDPSYEWRLSEGLKALKAKGAATGSYNSGALDRALLELGQNMASQEYGNAYSRASDSYNRNYNVWRGDTDSIYNKLAGLAGTGQATSNQLASQAMSTGNNIANTTMAGANTQANALLQGAQNRAGMYSALGATGMNAAGSYMNYNLLNNLMNKGYTYGSNPAQSW
jgi:hypothetical protein